MKTLISSKLFLTVVVAIGIAGVVNGSTGYKQFSLLLAALALLQLLKLGAAERNRRAIEKAFATYEEVVDGQLFVVRDAEVLACDRCDTPRDHAPLRYEYVCRTRRGQWFLFDVAVLHGRIVSRVEPCDEHVARLRLQRHHEAYAKCFGVLPVA